jgi:hypothetical protein
MLAEKPVSHPDTPAALLRLADVGIGHHADAQKRLFIRKGRQRTNEWYRPGISQEFTSSYCHFKFSFSVAVI